MTRLVFNWPDEAGEAVRAAQGRLAVAGERLARRSLEERLQVVADIVDAWSRADSPWRRELSALLANESPFHRETLGEGLESALRAWDPVRFIACARRELGGELESKRTRLAPFACTSVLAGGSIPMPTLLSGLLPLVLGSPVLLRETSRDPVTGPLLARSIAHRDAELGECLEVVRFPVEDDAAMEAFLSSPCVVATGSDATISAVSSKLEASQRFVAYGHRFSIAVLGPETTESEATLVSAAEGLARDVARWDQLGCLSPVVVYLVGIAPSARALIAARIAQALGALSASMPRGNHPPDILAAHATERSEARMRAAMDEHVTLIEGSDFTVALESDVRPRPAPLARFLRLSPVESANALEGKLAVFAPHLSNAAVAGFEASETENISRLLTQLGVSRICPPGLLQTPPIDWPHDGMPLFVPMARFVQSD
jgi:Acyl-CoA reductase (LuxC)